MPSGNIVLMCKGKDNINSSKPSEGYLCPVCKEKSREWFCSQECKDIFIDDFLERIRG